MSSKGSGLGGYNFYDKCIIQNSLDHHLAPSAPITNKKVLELFKSLHESIHAIYIYIYTSPSIIVEWKRPRSRKYIIINSTTKI